MIERDFDKALNSTFNLISAILVINVIVILLNAFILFNFAFN